MATKAKSQRKRNPSAAKKKGDKDAIVRFDNMSDAAKKAFEKLYRLEGEHAKAYQKGLFGNRSCAQIDEEMKKVKKDLCVDTGGDWKDIKPWFDIYSREQDALNEMEDEDRERVLNTHRIMFRSLDRGKMVNFLDILENKEWVPPVIENNAADAAANEAQEQAELEGAEAAGQA